MSIIDRIREFFGGKQSSAEYGAATGVAVTVTAADEPGRDVETPTDSGWSGGGESGGGGDGGGGGGA